MSELLVSFAVFIIAMIICISTSHTMVIALFIGLIAFSVVGLRKGFSIRKIEKMCYVGMKDAFVVVEVMFLIGFITAIWRSAGTITFFVYYGIKMITPNMFILITFALCCVLSYAIGTSFGVAGTMGVIFMALARSGGVNEIITAGVIMSGIYFGDRGSPVSSSAILVATITHTNLYDNVKMMMRTSLLPMAITIIIYAILSINNPIGHVEQSILTAFKDDFTISWITVIPAICMLLLPLLKVKIIDAMIASIASGLFISIIVQKMPLLETMKCMMIGYEAKSQSLGTIINGGGLFSMIEVALIVLLSSSYSGIFTGTGMLTDLQNKIEKLMNKIGRFATMTIFSLCTIGIFCNQTISTMMCSDILKEPYKEAGASSEELAIDIENSVIVLAGIVPWALSCYVPLGFMQVGFDAIPFAVLLFLIPICYGLTKKHFYK